MNQLQTFNHEMFSELPVVVVNGTEWFGATEAAKALSFAKPHDAIINHIETDDSAVYGVTDREKYFGANEAAKTLSFFNHLIQRR